MGTTAEKLYKILDSKEEIKQALIAKGINITDETTFAEYAEKINEITNGGAITDEEALLFIKDLADGKRKIAKAVRNKYEGTSGTASEITEYSTFDELSNKISQIPVEVPLGSAMEQNGGVLPFFDVYNETLKAMASVGTEFNGCCAFELDKWNYDNDDKVTLSGADAYYTSDGTFIKDNIIYKNGSQIGELDNSIYQFQDQDAENTNRFVVYFFVNERYQVPKTLPATSCFNLWCVKGTPLMNFNNDFSQLISINVYDGELEVYDVNDFKFLSIASNRKLRLYHIKEIKASSIFVSNYSLRELSLPNLTTISGGTSIFYDNAVLRKLVLPNLTTISGGSNIFYSNKELIEISLPNLTTISIIVNSFIINQGPKLQKLSLPNLTNINYGGYLINLSANQHFSSIDLSSLKISAAGIVSSYTITVDELKLDSFEEYTQTGSYIFVFLARIEKDEISLPKFHKGINIISSASKIKTLHIGDGMRDGVAGNIKIAYDTLSYLTTITVAEGFKAKLDLTGCNGLSREVLVDILNNLADLTDTEYADKLTLTLGSTLYDRITADDRLIATNKKWQVVK